MDFKNYCVLIMGKNIDKDDLQDTIIGVSHNAPKFIDAQGIFFTTFMSAFKPKELKDLFTGDGRSVMVFDTDEESSACHLADLDLHNHLFGDLADNEAVKEISDSLMDEIRRTTQNSGTTTGNITRKAIKAPARKNTKEYLSKLNKTELQDKTDEILDKGAENLTKEDKRLLKQIAKYK